MKTITCDYCGGKIESDVFALILRGPTVEFNHFDLCQDCANRIHNFTTRVFSGKETLIDDMLPQQKP